MIQLHIPVLALHTIETYTSMNEKVMKYTSLSYWSESLKAETSKNYKYGIASRLESETQQRYKKRSLKYTRNESVAHPLRPPDPFRPKTLAKHRIFADSPCAA